MVSGSPLVLTFHQYLTVSQNVILRAWMEVFVCPSIRVNVPQTTEVLNANMVSKNPFRNIHYNLNYKYRIYLKTKINTAASACDVRKLAFNGGYNCFGDSEKFSCKLSCPSGASLSSSNTDEYTCLYSTGVFEPQPIPHCVFGRYNDSCKTFLSFGRTHSIFNLFQVMSSLSLHQTTRAP